jgi:hypothetical protein
VEDKVLVRFLFPRESREQELVWLLSNYMHMVQEHCVSRGSAVTLIEVGGGLKERLTMLKTRAVEQPLILML